MAIQLPYPPASGLCLYSCPVISAPLSDPAFHDSVASALLGVADKLVGLAGTVAVGEPLTSSDSAPFPSALIARTWKW